MKVFSIFDAKVSAYMQPFFSRTAGEATRAFADLVGEAQHPVAKHPGDYTLFELGEFDDQTGVLTSHVAPLNLGTALSYRPQQGVKLEA